MVPDIKAWRDVWHFDWWIVFLKRHHLEHGDLIEDHALMSLAKSTISTVARSSCCNGLVFCKFVLLSLASCTMAA